MNKNEVDFFYHATGDTEETYDTMLAIINDGAIKSKRLQRKDLGQSLFNGDDYISVAAWDNSIDKDSSEFFLKSSFPGFVMGLPCFIISGDIDAIKCEPYTGSYDSSKERVSQYLDEWHVKDKIDLDKVVGIALPKEQHTEEEKETTRKILECAKLYNWEVFVSDKNLVDSVRERFASIEKKEK
ncbi:MAG: hypothetical protein IJN90_02510 [Bacilli bacterium]|nr:hypothetical protein [Bacilli bacterium]